MSKAIELAKECGFSKYQAECNAYKLDRFAALVAAATREETCKDE